MSQPPMPVLCTLYYQDVGQEAADVTFPPLHVFCLPSQALFPRALQFQMRISALCTF